jgi:hypothetical protein
MLHRYPSLDWQDCPVAFRLRGLARPVVSVKISLVFPPGDMPYMGVGNPEGGNSVPKYCSGCPTTGDWSALRTFSHVSLTRLPRILNSAAWDPAPT